MSLCAACEFGLSQFARHSLLFLRVAPSVQPGIETTASHFKKRREAQARGLWNAGTRCLAPRASKGHGHWRGRLPVAGVSVLAEEVAADAREVLLDDDAQAIVEGVGGDDAAVGGGDPHAAHARGDIRVVAGPGGGWQEVRRVKGGRGGGPPHHLLVQAPRRLDAALHDLLVALQACRERRWSERTTQGATDGAEGLAAPVASA